MTFESDNVFSMHREIVYFGKEIRYEMGKVEVLSRREAREDDEFFIFRKRR